MDLLEEQIRAALEDLNRHIEQILTVAAKALTEPDQWQDLMTSYDVKPASQTESSQAAQFNHVQGALPLEVRNVLLALQRRYKSTVRHLEEGQSSHFALFNHLDDRHEKFVDKAVKDYIDRIRPKVTMLSIFANALATTAAQQQTAEQLSTKTCGCCGAARPGDTSLKTCAYCGNAFFQQTLE